MTITFYAANMRFKRIAALTLLPVAALASRARAAVTYNFAQIATVSSQTFPALNNGGVVAFDGALSSIERGVYTGSGGPLTFIAPGSPTGNLAWINNAGQVAFTNSVALGVFTVSRGTGGPLTSIHTYSNGAPHETGYGMNVIADDGTVTYMSTNSGVFSGTGGPVITVSPIAGTNSSQYLGGFEGLAVSHNGTLAYEKYPNSSVWTGQSIVVNHAGIETVVITLPTALGANTVNSIAVNNNGMVAMTGAFSFQDSGLYLADGTTFTRVVGPDSGVQVLGNASINDAGDFAFLGTYISNNTIFNGIFTGPDPIQNKIIQTGDALAGSTVTKLLIGTEAINDSGEVVFWAQLANGSSGIFTASAVPEPASLGFLVMAGVPLLLRRRRAAV